ncbi:sugar MFS transporter [Leptolyngbya sp. FACHB-261]|uniref:MFS transporter n=1 Tax=Leptolyngbya sp. FACHB-261 TaxID=2692806 RepID=UPI001687DE9D|nr:MFS transporter [Leptolyngbya sp. FACHB-261]MBD2103306.1 MFS transporter [Leptolyngbya sp. FACHB-261]
MNQPSHGYRVRWLGVAISFYAFIAIGVAEGGLGVLLPSILTTYQLTPATITLLFLSQVIGYLVAALSSSLLSSQLGLARLLLLAATLLAGCLGIYAVVASWPLMVATGVLFGLGIGWIDAGINTYLANDQRNADLMGILHAFYGLGALLGPAIATTLLALALNWRQVYLVFAVMVGILVLALLWAVVTQDRSLTTKLDTAAPSARASLRLALKMPVILAASLFLMVYVGLESSLGNWAYSVQTISRGTPELVAGYSVSAYWFGLSLGRLLTGRVVALVGAVKSISGSLALLTVGLLAWWLLPGQLLSLPLLGLALATIFPTTIWLMPQRLPAHLVPGAISLMTGLAGFGAAVIPTAVGWLADRVGLESIPVMMLPLVVLMIGLHYWLSQIPASSAAPPAS